jgi:hypothetical protein
MNTKAISFFTIALALLVTLTGLSGIIRPSIYEAESFNWQVQTVWQDYVDIFFIVPVLVISGIFSSKVKTISLWIWAGALLYLCYTYLIFAFTIHFNHSFLFYCVIIGLSFYGILWFFHSVKRYAIRDSGRSWTLSIYLILTGTVFYFAWLADIMPGILVGAAPASVEEAGLFTNPVEVLDISIVLPGYIICGGLLISRHELGKVLAPVLLSFGALMGFSTATLRVILVFNQLAHSLPVAVFLLFIAIANICFLIRINGSQVLQHSFNQTIPVK